MKRKIMAVLLAAAMTGSLAGCGSTQNKNAADASEEKMKVAMVTDSGDITDQSFNQMTYEACKAWGKENDIEFNYYKPQSDSDEARTASVDQAVADGANVIVLSGYVFAPTVIDESDLYPEVKFLALDVSAGDICEKGIGEGYDYNPDHYNVTDYYNEDNVYCCTYQEELSGFMAGYAAVMLGYRHLGFLGGMSVPAVNRYGYGYVQGADAAAKELESQMKYRLSMYVADSSMETQISRLTWIPGMDQKVWKLYLPVVEEFILLRQRRQLKPAEKLSVLTPTSPQLLTITKKA